MTAEWVDRPEGQAVARFIMAHGAGAPADSPFMTHIAQGLAALGVEVIRFEFDYMAQRRIDGKRRPPPRSAELLMAQWRAIIATSRAGSLPLFIGGKSMGGRLASLIADASGAAGLICFGYPFHPQAKPDQLRIAHLQSLRTPALILQGTRDALGNNVEVPAYPLAPSIRLHWLQDGDHDLKPRVASGFRHEQHLASAIAATAAFIQQQTRCE